MSNISENDRIQFNISVGSNVDNNLPTFIVPSPKPPNINLLTTNILNYINNFSNLITGNNK